jgi:toxin ParE1/3/4
MASSISKPINIRPLASADIDNLAHFISTDSLEAANRFLGSIEQAFARISEQPGIGSRRYALPPYPESLRFWPVPTFAKYLVFYLDLPDCIEVLRVLHGARDIPNLPLE